MNCLSKETIQLLKKINKINKNIFHDDNLSKNKFFMDLYKKIKKIIKSKNINNININSINIILVNDKPNKYLVENKFTSKNIYNKILNKLKYCHKCIFGNNTLIYFTEKKVINNNIIINIFKIIKLLKTLFKRENYEQTIIYFEIDEKKKFPKIKESALGPDNVNSGLTFLDTHKNGNIILYRKQEVLKVLIHELIHSNLIDSNIIFSKNLKDFSNKFCVNYNILLNEAFTESFATIINLFYIHIICNFNIKELDNMFYNELYYSDYICSKIINFYNILKISDVLKKGDYCKSNFPQKTNVFAYYILKNILLKKHIEFGKILEKYNISKDYKLCCENGIVELINLIMKNINILDNNIINIKNDNNNTLRLCLYEIL
jgi:hypothetical protein